MLFKKYDPLKNKMFQILNPQGKIVNEDLVPNIPDEKLIHMYRSMVIGRVADIKAVQFQRQGRMLTYAPNQGQEAAQIGAMAALEKTDWLSPAFREFNAMIYHGVTLEQAFLYWYGNERGSHFNEGVNVLPVNITIGAQINHAAGLAYASKVLNKGQVVITFIGDGGTSHGEFHEGVNFAGVYDLPVIIVIQNNQWAISTPRAKATKAQNLAQKAIGYGIPGIMVDGNDVLAMYVATRFAAERARRGEGPTLIEAITYRLGPHTTSDDPTIYRSESEVEEWRKKDPIDRFRIYLEQKGLWDINKEEALQEEANQYVLETFKKVEQKGAVVELEEIFMHMYEKLPPLLEEQLNNYKKFLQEEEK
ncbi:MAG: pyruvate dehydrogenase (acetyl-transferring) E1 component subunit alpha [Acholeplasmataceae bacterium]|nr:pyruvate dehydrogenase (acetyl-transferring) E1 component subunit alpha [Acholeplasmataceae bacterium]HOA63581.1 pyruvate dehydrogenase (acetyl-transferring) E1 component subunit alpha [Bacilli bacterium]HPT89534.1 pyruvate dehydrogenase (acetyl-transferring) E1 component subunit alpha [Bacilli bacterium]HQD92088.1 pyruvate dehydrogenase (acetyl-transferring) E1 component subunit alpha [Bacilli bacterium]